jgi:beta-lactamase regulating signal transducer with metallopeptidase domain
VTTTSLIEHGIDLAIRAPLAAVATAALLALFRVRTSRVRHIAWSGFLLLFLLLPFVRAWAPAIRIKVPAALPVQSFATVARGSLSIPLQSIRPKAAVENIQPRIETRPKSGRAGNGWLNLLLAIYGAGAAFLLARLATGTILARRLIREAMVREAADASMAGSKIVSARCVSPVTVGWFRPVVLLPPSWGEWPDSKMAAVLAHEAEHVRWRDPLVQWLALFTRAVFWFHPLAWWLERKLNRLAEEACDQAALTRGVDAGDYAGYLLQFARSVSLAGTRINGVGMSMPGGLLRQRLGQLNTMRRAGSLAPSRVVPAAVACFAVSFGIANAMPEKSVLPERVDVAVRNLMPPPLVAVTAPVAVIPPPQETIRYEARQRAEAIEPLPVPSPPPPALSGAIYFDLASLPEQDRLRGINAVASLMPSMVAAGHQATLLLYGGGPVESARIFTGDAAELLHQLRNLPPVQDAEIDETDGDQVDALEAVADRLDGNPGEKRIIWVGSQTIVADPVGHLLWDHALSALGKRGVHVAVVPIVTASPSRN